MVYLMGMKSAASKVVVSRAVRGLGDEAFVNFNVRMGSMVANATAELGQLPTTWTVHHLGITHTLQDSGSVRGLSRMRGPTMSKVLRAIESGRM